MTEPKRVAFTGPSGTGKSTLMAYVAEHFKLEANPIGSRSVSKAMGFASPYDVDSVPGKRAEFQNRLLIEKMLWEAEHDSFVTDRTTFDNLVYSMLHDVHSVKHEYLVEAVRGFQRYTHVFYCPFEAFCDPGDDAARVKDLTYHALYDFALWGLLDRYAPSYKTSFLALNMEGVEERKREVFQVLQF